MGNMIEVYNFKKKIRRSVVLGSFLINEGEIRVMFMVKIFYVFLV